MFDAYLNKLKEIFSSRLVYLSIMIIVLFSILVGRMYSLQILAVATEEGNTTGDSNYQS